MKKKVKFFRLRWLLPTTIVLVIAAAVFWRFSQQQPHIETTRVTRGRVVQVVEVSGKIESRFVVELRFPIAEKLVWVGVQEGDRVARSQVLATLEKEKLAATLRQAEQDFIAAKAEVEKVYDETGRKVDESFTEKVKRTAAETKQNKAHDAMRKAQEDLKDATLIAPISGVVVKSDITTAGAHITTSQTITVADLENLVFTVDVDESDIGNVKAGQRVNITLDAYPNRPIEGTVERIAVISRGAEGGGTVFETTVDLRKISEINLRMGMNGDGEIVIEEKDNILAVPNEAVIDENAIFVIRDGRREKRSVRTGIVSDTKTEIVEGLSEGDVVVTNPQKLPQQSNRSGIFRIFRR